MKRGIQLRRVRLLGPKAETRDIHFGEGLNVLHGGSNTGKSHLVSLIDYAFGGRTKPTLPPEGSGHDAIMITVELPDSSRVTLCRSMTGGGIRVVQGSIDNWPSEKIGEIYTDQHGRGRSLSEFLLAALNIGEKRLRRNAAGATRALSFRDMIHLFVVDETKIQSKTSPIESGQVILKTAELSAFKFVITGVDDEKLDSVRTKTDALTRTQIELEFVDQEISELSKTLEVSETDLPELSAQMERLDNAFDSEFSTLEDLKTPYQSMLTSRREIRQTVSYLTERDDEISFLLERFALLDAHYKSDIARLEAIDESGRFFQILDSKLCPLCGADPENHRPDAPCDANITEISTAARAEISRIKMRREELESTKARLESEQSGIPPRLSAATEKLAEADIALSREKPDIRAAQHRVREIMDAQTQVQSKLALFSRLDSFRDRRKTLVGEDGGDSTSVIAATEIPGAVRSALESQIEAVLKRWQFPGAGRVLFDLKARDIEINGKPRASNGKGVRAVLHAAFSIALTRYCSEEELPEPGFLILDSPLITYRDPLNSDSPQEPDDALIAKTDLKERVFEDLKSWPSHLQLIIIENVDLPDWVASHSNTTTFTGNPNFGRSGLY